ncbi:hypothetical protein F4827_004192 [Paraburkholderia bannensis]|uniref:UPF0276 protein F4827_004192 n=1 Tax=Paraburkholderia bannensis TaxID=765414 RepID=A0A7W9TZQ1_9BURK|nr:MULTISPECIES: DUF692 domain-containing protein [Paraburkholderia]MBB3259317.1 hypothetical protein [Paraburkholderia sp. WP4_3_2]MBB6104333.1 hypothetical protein [Paraburkholderia bannensis]
MSGRPALVGTSFKHGHLGAILDDGFEDGFFEVHAENYMGAGGPPHRALASIRERHAVSLHGVCMSLGSPDALDTAHLARFRDLVARYEPAFVSEHLAWSSHGGSFFNDLLPLPYNRATLAHLCAHIDQMQNAIGRTILLENPSTYVMFASSTMSETGFLREVAQRTGCGLLLDVNNVFVSAVNHGFSAHKYLAAFPLEYVGEIHLAGHSEQRDDENQPLLIDSHDRPVADRVWDLYREVISRIGTVPTLIEWDSDLPDWDVLRAQAEAARQVMTRVVTAYDGGVCHAS